MRFLVTLLIFVVAAPTIIGSLIIPLTDPSWGFNAQELFPYLALGGALAALPISYIIAGIIMKRVRSQGTA